MLTFNENNGKYKNWRSPKVEIFEFCFDPSILLIFLIEKHVLFEFLTLKWLNYMHFLFWPSESPSYNYVHLKFLIFIESTYFSHMMITRGGAVRGKYSCTDIPIFPGWKWKIYYSSRNTFCERHVWMNLMFKNLCEEFPSGYFEKNYYQHKRTFS